MGRLPRDSRRSNEFPIVEVLKRYFHHLILTLRKWSRLSFSVLQVWSTAVYPS